MVEELHEGHRRDLVALPTPMRIVGEIDIALTGPYGMLQFEI